MQATNRNTKVLIIGAALLFVFLYLTSNDNNGSSGSGGHDEPSPEQPLVKQSNKGPKRGQKLALPFDATEHGVQFEVAKTTTDPPFLQVIVPREDKCKNFPGICIAQNGFFAPVETSIFRHVLKDGCKKLNSKGQPPLVIDVGGNIGYFAAYAAALGCRVIAFEPMPKVIRFLNMTLLLNQFQDRVDVHMSAASNHKGKTSGTLNCWDTGLSGVNPGGDVPVYLETLDDIIQEDVLLLKVDTEGYEDVVFRGMQKALEQYEIHNIICETKKNNDVQYKVDFINRMIDEGYKVSSYAEHYPGDPGYWKDRLHQSFDFTMLNRLREVNQADWFPNEDLWYQKVPK